MKKRHSPRNAKGLVQKTSDEKEALPEKRKGVLLKDIR
jgi:hypothetical protein